MGLPLCEKISGWLEPPEVFEQIKGLPYPFLLDTAMLVDGLGYHSFLGFDPFLIMASKGRHVILNEKNKITRLDGSPLAVLKTLLNKYAMPAPGDAFPFHGGAVGYFSYDLGRQYKNIPQWAADDLQTPDLFLGFYDTIMAMDMKAREMFVISTGLPLRGRAGYQRAGQRIKLWMEHLARSSLSRDLPGPGHEPVRLSSNFTPHQYQAAVGKVIQKIEAGDIRVVNLTQRFCTPKPRDPWCIYRQLREINPAPFAAFLSCGDLEVICASPERFLKVADNIVETRPIKGTRPRGRTPQEDQLLRRELWESEKDRAELKMVVDMECRYLDQVCQPGSIKVPELYRVESYATVYQLVSTVQGHLRPGLGISELLAATFPGGSITGAPKTRAMEIIEEMESVRRGVYTGSIGYIGFDGQLDLNVVIRTILARDNNLYFQVGGGITQASEPRAEYMETLDKARALARAVGVERALVDLYRSPCIGGLV